MSRSVFDNYAEKTIEEKIQILEQQISEDRYYLEYGGMSNQMKIRRRKKSIRDCNLKLIELKKTH